MSLAGRSGVWLSLCAFRRIPFPLETEALYLLSGGALDAWVNTKPGAANNSSGPGQPRLHTCLPGRTSLCTYVLLMRSQRDGPPRCSESGKSRSKERLFLARHGRHLLSADEKKCPLSELVKTPLTGTESVIGVIRAAV